ncbi:hypothetical protein FNF27_05669 [Cafeteria roenbergensis]|uniref:Kinesin-like protein n=1 Tax=Cafeteria roenbergensis TaxID=33653 RepID=A0A5A8E650_CAFRO|nr:hypothetical protein FNF27_05669 [Cafeteria roenbergensis]
MAGAPPSRGVMVCIRTRPTAAFAQDEIIIDEEASTVTVHDAAQAQSSDAVNNRKASWGFKFHSVLHNASQETVYDRACRHVVAGVTSGQNGTIMAYGQTGAGKTFTMIGDTKSYASRGVAPRALSHLFGEMESRPESVFSVRCSYMEIYNGRIRDLLSDVPPLPSGPTGGDAGIKAGAQALAEAKTPTVGSGGELTVAEDPVMGTVVRGLTMLPVESEEAALDALFQGDLRRTTAEHSLNRRSNRSHCVFTLFVTQRSRLGTAERAVLSRLNLVDLAGSERIKKTLGRAAAAGARTDETLQRESMAINQSLSALEQCVVALTSKARSHVPFRSSTLTSVLKDSLGGTSRTVLLACVWGEHRHLEETVSTLNLAQRMTRVKSKAAAAGAGVLVDDAARAARLEREVAELRQELAMHDALAERGAVSYGEYGPEERDALRAQLEEFVAADDAEGEAAALPLQSVRQMKEALRLAKALIRESRAAAEDAAASGAAAVRASTAATGGGGRGASAGRGAGDAGDGLGDEADLGRPAEAVGDLDQGLSGVSLGRTATSARPPTGMRTQPRGVARPPPGSEAAAAGGGSPGRGSPERRGGAASPGTGARRGVSMASMSLGEGAAAGGAGEDMAEGKDWEAAPPRSQPLGFGDSPPRSYGGGGGRGGAGADGQAYRQAWAQFRGRGGDGERLAAAAQQAAAEAAEQRAAVEAAAREVNAQKQRIDDATAELGRIRRSRSGGGGGGGDAAGSGVVDADEFSALQALSEGKASYREAAAVLRARADGARAAGRRAAAAKGELVRAFEAWFENRTGERLSEAVLSASSPLRGAGGGDLSASPLARRAVPSPFRGAGGGAGGGDVGGFGPSGAGAAFHAGTGEETLAVDASGDVLDDGEAFERLEADRVAARDPDALAYFKAGKRMAGTLRESRRTGVKLAHGRR